MSYPYEQKETHQFITSETNIVDIKPGLHINCGAATLPLHEEGGWALVGGGRAIGGSHVKNAALKLSERMKQCGKQDDIRWHFMKPSVENYHG